MAHTELTILHLRTLELLDCNLTMLVLLEFSSGEAYGCSALIYEDLTQGTLQTMSLDKTSVHVIVECCRVTRNNSVIEIPLTYFNMFPYLSILLSSCHASVICIGVCRCWDFFPSGSQPKLSISIPQEFKKDGTYMNI